MADLLKLFGMDPADLVARLLEATAALEPGHADQSVNARLARFAGLLKGAARLVRLHEVAELGRKVEELLAPYARSRRPIPEDVIDELRRHADRIAERMSTLIGVPMPIARAPGTADAPAPPAAPAESATTPPAPEPAPPPCTGPGPAEPPPPAPVPEPATAVLVVGEGIAGDALRAAIAELGHRVELAAGEQAALAAATAEHVAFVIDAACGIELTRRTRADRALRAVPAIVVVAGDARAAWEAGATACVAPNEIDAAMLDRVIRAWSG